MGAITYRFATDADPPRIRRLWRNGGWGGLPAATEVWAKGSPHGELKVVVGEDDETGELMAMLSLVPTAVAVDGRERRAVRFYAPIVSRDLRRFILRRDHPAQGLVRWAARAMRELGYALMYGLPDPRWYGAIRRHPLPLGATFPLWSLPLPPSSPLEPGEGFRAASLAAWDERVDRLWRLAAGSFGCTPVRDARTLRWKLSRGGFEVTAIERGGELVGLVAGQAKGDRQWLLGDLLAADDGKALRATLAAACDHAQARAAAGLEVAKVGLLVTPHLQPAAAELGFVRDDYDFALAVVHLDQALPRDSIAPERWYVSAND